MLDPAHLAMPLGAGLATGARLTVVTFLGVPPRNNSRLAPGDVLAGAHWLSSVSVCGTELVVAVQPPRLGLGSGVNSRTTSTATWYRQCDLPDRPRPDFHPQAQCARPSWGTLNR